MGQQPVFETLSLPTKTRRLIPESKIFAPKPFKINSWKISILFEGWLFFSQSMQRTQLEDPRDISKLDPFWSTKYHFHQTHCGCTHIQTTGHGIEDVINTSVYICAVYLSVVGGVHMRPKCICRMSINIAYLVITSLHTRTKYVFVDINISYIYIYIFAFLIQAFHCLWAFKNGSQHLPGKSVNISTSQHACIARRNT